MARYAQPLVPPHTGGSTPSSVSYSTNATWASSNTSYPYSAGPNNSQGRSSRMNGKDVKSLTGIRPEQPATMKKSSSSNSSSIPQLNKQRSNSSLASPPLSAYSNQDILSPPTLVRKDTKSSSFSQAKIKIKPLLRKVSSQERSTVDLSRSVAENEGLGIFTNSNLTTTSNLARRGYHTRSSSGISQNSTTTTSSTHYRHGGSQYVHPMRQTSQSYTPPITRSRSRPDSLDDSIVTIHSQPPSLPHSYAPLPLSKRTPPPSLHVRTGSNNSRANSSSQLNLNTAGGTSTVPGTPSTLRHFNQSPQEPSNPDAMPLTARSSLESAFGRKRSRANTNNTTSPTDDHYATVQALRAEFYAKEAAKDAKYAEVAARQAEREARRQEKRQMNQRRKQEAAERKHGNSGDEYCYENEKDNGDGATISTFEHQALAPGGLPVDEELEWIRKGKRPPKRATVQRRHTNGTTSSSVGKKAKAVGNGWGLFWFQVKTMWLKLKRGVGIKSG